MTIYTNKFDVSYVNGKIHKISADFCRGFCQTKEITLDNFQNNKTEWWAYIKLFRKPCVKEEYKFPSETSFKTNNGFVLNVVQKGNFLAFKLQMPGISREPLFFVKER